MGINTTKYVRKPLYVEAVQVTEENFDELVGWCNGTVEIEESNGKKFIRIWVHNPMGPRQTKAFVDDWILRHQKGFKIYTQKAFEASFDEVQTEKAVSNAGPIVDQLVTVPERALKDETSLESEVKKQLTEPIPCETAPAPGDTPIPGEVAVSDSPSAPPPVSAEGKRVLTLAEQQTMGPDEVRALLRAGETVLAQDLTEHVA